MHWDGQMLVHHPGCIRMWHKPHPDGNGMGSCKHLDAVRIATRHRGLGRLSRIDCQHHDVSVSIRIFRDKSRREKVVAPFGAATGYQSILRLLSLHSYCLTLVSPLNILLTNLIAFLPSRIIVGKLQGPSCFQLLQLLQLCIVINLSSYCFLRQFIFRTVTTPGFEPTNM